MDFNFLSDVIGIEFPIAIDHKVISYLMVKENHLDYGTKFYRDFSKATGYNYDPSGNFFTKTYAILNKFALDKIGRTCYCFKADITRIVLKSETYYYVQNK